MSEENKMAEENKMTEENKVAEETSDKKTNDEPSKSAEKEKKKEKTNTLYIWGLDKELDEEFVRQELTRYIDVKRITILKDKKTNQSRGFGYVELSSPAAATKAFKVLDGVFVGGNPIRVKFSHSTTPDWLKFLDSKNPPGSSHHDVRRPKRSIEEARRVADNIARQYDSEFDDRRLEKRPLYDDRVIPAGRSFPPRSPSAHRVVDYSRQELSHGRYANDKSVYDYGNGNGAAPSRYSSDMEGLRSRYPLREDPYVKERAPIDPYEHKIADYSGRYKCKELDVNENRRVIKHYDHGTNEGYTRRPIDSLEKRAADIYGQKPIDVYDRTTYDHSVNLADRYLDIYDKRNVAENKLDRSSNHQYNYNDSLRGSAYEPDRLSKTHIYDDRRDLYRPSDRSELYRVARDRSPPAGRYVEDTERSPNIRRDSYLERDDSRLAPAVVNRSYMEDMYPVRNVAERPQLHGYSSSTRASDVYENIYSR